MIIETIQGDLIAAFEAGEVAHMAHGCNCYNVMGAGIAKFIRQAFPQVFEADALMHNIHYGEAKLGMFSTVSIGGKRIYNLYTQREPQPPVSYEAVVNAFSSLNKRFPGITLGIPKIGAGLAGGEWDTIAEIINNNTPDIDVVVYVLE